MTRSFSSWSTATGRPLLKKDLANKLAGSYKIYQIDKYGLYELEKMKSAIPKELIVLSINEKSYSAEEFIKFRESGKGRQIMSDFDQFRTEKIIEYHKEHLENNNTEFALTLKEYAEGILLFDLLENNIWKKAESDSVGLLNYYQENIKNYYWKKSTHVVIANCNEKEKAEQVRDLLLAGKNVEQIKASVNDGATIHVLFKEAVLELPSNKLPLNFEEQIGVSKVYTEDEKHFTVVHVLELKPPKPKTLQENKGQVMNDYQNHLEQVWVKSLHQEIIRSHLMKKKSNELEKLILQPK
ncbi:MAG: peptidylprolyl isomerase [Flavobacteriaceae bacterium]|nr:peptidylprolyl isomerase [Flavobacteriaceae bacterium]